MLRTSIIVFCFTVVGFFNTSFLNAQPTYDTIYLLNGNVVIGTITYSAGEEVTVKPIKQAANRYVIEFERIFSINTINGEKLMYRQDTLIGNDFTIEEMRHYLQGESDALKAVKVPGALIGNMLVGLAGGITGSLLSPIPVFVFTALSGLPRVKVKPQYVSKPQYLNTPIYESGYKRVVRRKRKMQSLIGGGIGFGIGLGSFFILSSMGYTIIK